VNARPILTAALLLATAAAADAATVLTFQEAAPGAAGQPKVVRQMLLEGGHLRVEGAGPKAEGPVLLFKAETGTLQVLDEGKRSYTEVHRSVVPFQMEEEQTGDKRVAKAKKGEPAPAPALVSPAGVSYTKVDSGFIVNGFRTDKYEGTKGGSKVEEVYVADFKALGLTDADFATLRALAGTFAADSKDPIQMSLTAAGAVPGVPVRSTRFEGGKPAVQVDLSAVRQEEAPAGAFEVPAGYTRQAQGLSSGS
jgi:Domain of unknown function (DUF4412)